MYNMRETKMEIFSPEIYPINLYVAVNPTIEFLRERFYQSDSKGDVSDIKEYTGSAIASVIHCVYKEKKEYCPLCCIWDRRNFRVGTIAHESLHIASLIYKILNIEMDNFYGGGNEPLAYLVGWAARCLYKTKISSAPRSNKNKGEGENLK